MDRQSDLNREYWNALTPVHAASGFYDVEGFLSGQTSLHNIERDAVGVVAGKSLLHLQCHFGLDTLSWARLGAEVVGVDFSSASIARARELAGEAGLSSRAAFIERDVLNLGDAPVGKFDIVFTSYGTIGWLPSLELWARAIAEALADGGFFFMVDTHPTSELFEGSGNEQLIRRYDYFHSSDPLRMGPHKDYADSNHTTLSAEAWIWSLADVFGSLERAGLVVYEFREYSKTVYQQFPGMRRTTDDYWELMEGSPSLPLLFSLKARSQVGPSAYGAADIAPAGSK